MQLPEPLARLRMRDTQGIQQPRCRSDPVDHPKRCRVRRHRPEQRVLLADHTEVRDALAAVDEHHREIAEHPARVMTATPLLDLGQLPRERSREPHLLSDLRHERRTRMRYQARSVRRDFYGYLASITHHLQGDLQARDQGPSTSPRIPAQPDVSAPPLTPGARSLLHAPG